MHEIGMKVRLTLYYEDDQGKDKGENKREVNEVAYQFLGLDPPNFRLHESVKVWTTFFVFAALRNRKSPKNARN